MTRRHHPYREAGTPSLLKGRWRRVPVCGESPDLRLSLNSKRAFQRESAQVFAGVAGQEQPLQFWTSYAYRSATGPTSHVHFSCWRIARSIQRDRQERGQVMEGVFPIVLKRHSRQLHAFQLGQVYSGMGRVW